MTKLTRSYTVAYAGDFKNEMQGWTIVDVKSVAGAIEFYLLRNKERRILRLSNQNVFFSMIVYEGLEE